jgi:hypothetical protein
MPVIPGLRSLVCKNCAAYMMQAAHEIS